MAYLREVRFSEQPYMKIPCFRLESISREIIQKKIILVTMQISKECNVSLVFTLFHHFFDVNEFRVHSRLSLIIIR